VVSERYSALGWGEQTAAQVSTMAAITRHRFTGQEELDNAGVWAVNLNGRIYQPSGSSFYSPDPYIPDPEDTRDYDRYAYAVNSPLSYTDPTGFDQKPGDNNSNLKDNTGGAGGAPGSPSPPSVPWPGDPIYIPGLPEPPPPLPLTCPLCAPPTLPLPPGFPAMSPANSPPHGPAPGPKQCGKDNPCKAQQTKPCGGAGGSQVGPPSNGNSNSDQLGTAAADAGLTLSDLGLQAADNLTKNIQAPPDIDIGSIGVLSKGVTGVGLGISGYQTVFGSTAQIREQAAQDTAVNAFGLRYPAAAPFTTVPYDLGRMARELYDAWKNYQAAKLLDEAAQCTYGK